MQKDTLIGKIKNQIEHYKTESALFCSFWNSLLDQENFYIIGGAIRSIYNGKKPRDLDIVLKSGIDCVLKSIGNTIPVSRNYYGGFKIDFNGISVDFWDFENHWAFKSGVLPADEKFLAESCFFDFDALVYSPITDYLDIGRYLQAIDKRTIDIIKKDHNYVTCNPGDLTNVLRAMVVSNEFNLSFSTTVSEYVRKILEKYDFASLKKCENRHYKEERITFEQYNSMIKMLA